MALPVRGRINKAFDEAGFGLFITGLICPSIPIHRYRYYFSLINKCTPPGRDSVAERL